MVKDGECPGGLVHITAGLLLSQLPCMPLASHLPCHAKQVIAGLWDPYSDIHMGSCAELCAAKYNISREQQVQEKEGSRGGLLLRCCRASVAAMHFKLP